MIELFAPPAVGGAIAFTMLFAKEASLSFESAVLLAALSILYGYAFAFLPSCVYVLLMEWAFSSGLRKRSAGAVLLSVFLGAISGAVIGYCFESRLARQAGIYSAIGAATGLVVGVVVAFAGEDKKPSVGHSGTQ